MPTKMTVGFPSQKQDEIGNCYNITLAYTNVYPLRLMTSTGRPYVNEDMSRSPHFRRATLRYI